MTRALISIWRVLLALVDILVLPVVAALIVGAGLAVVGAEHWPLLAWAALSPVLYLVWLLAFLAIGALEFQVVGRIWPKPRRMDNVDSRLTVAAAVIIHTSQRFDLVHALPFATTFLRVPVLQKLFLLSFSPRATVGHDVLIYGKVYDPEYISLGDRSVVGGGSALAAHAFVNRGRGKSSYVTAPIRIGADATIGGESRVGPGVTVGEGSVVEPGAVVEPFTRIPPDEVWGGAPARFQRSTLGTESALVVRTDVATRSESAQATTPLTSSTPPARPGPVGAVAPEVREAARRLVANALNLRLDEVGPSTSYGNAEGWDSLGQLVIATLAQERYGVAVDQESLYLLRTLDDVARLIGGQPTAVASSGARALAPDGTGDDIRSDEVWIDGLPADAELLPLADRAAATAALAADPDRWSTTRRATMIIAATFTAEPLLPSLRTWCRAFGVELDVEVAPFGQIEAALLAPSGAFRAGPADAIRVVLVRAEDLASEAVGRGARADGILDAIELFTADGGSLVVGTLPPLMEAASERERSEHDVLRGAWRRRLQSAPDVDTVDVSAVVERLGTMVAADPAAEVVSRMPWSGAASRDLGIELARIVRRRFVPRRKVVAVDCDGTLWRGVVGEDGVQGLGISGDGPDRAFQLFQRRLRELREHGVLLALVSRNEEADVWRVFDEHPGMVLTRDDIAAWRIGWRPKSELIREIADELGFSLDAFVFLDDDRAVRREVGANAPGVLVVPLPDDPLDRVATLGRLWAFDGPAATEVDLARTRMARDERNRQESQSAATDMATYLRDLSLVVTIAPASEAELPRVAQLTQRTNQFNTSLRRRTLDEIRALARDTTILSLSARDRFGDYGLVGTAILATDGSATATLDSLLLSCRALGRGVEESLLSAVAARARAAGATCLAAAYVDGPRNSPALDFLRANGFAPDDTGVLVADLQRTFEVPTHVSVQPAASVPAPSVPAPSVPA